jgi:hypothetical protein
MDNNLKQQLNSLKSIKPTDSWVQSTREELFPKEESFFFNSLQPKFAFGSLAMAGLLFGLIVVGNYGSYPQVEMTRNKITPRVKEIVELMQKREAQSMLAENDNQESDQIQTMTAQIDYNNLSEEEQKELVKEETKRMLAEIADLEERVSRVMGIQKDSDN